MQSLEQNLTQYAAYHRDRRNIATHFVGIPMIVLAGVTALATVTIHVGGMDVTLAAVLAIAACAYYLVLDVLFGVTMAVVLFAACALASEAIARLGAPWALAAAAAVFVAGWALQYLGHHYEGIKPAFYDDVKQLLIGPLFLCAETFFALGAKPALKRYIDERVGPVVARRTGMPPGKILFEERDPRAGQGADRA
jgi:uncharacterized membrane protein YGL010W